jgi:hypothetical protein
MSGKSHANPKDPTVKATSPTTPNSARLGKAEALRVGCDTSDSEADGDCCTKAIYLANDFQVSITLSGLSEIELMP